MSFLDAREHGAQRCALFGCCFSSGRASRDDGAVMWTRGYARAPGGCISRSAPAGAAEATIPAAGEGPRGPAAVLRRPRCPPPPPCCLPAASPLHFAAALRHPCWLQAPSRGAASCRRSRRWVATCSHMLWHLLPQRQAFPAFLPPPVHTPRAPPTEPRTPTPIQAVDRRERLRRLALETIDLSKDPYFMRNHLGQYECRLCLTLHTNEGNYLAHTQGARLCRAALRRATPLAACISQVQPRLRCACAAL